MVYNLVLFAHILGAFGLIAAYTIEAIGLRGLRGATRRDEAVLWFGISRGVVMRLAPAFVLLAAVGGVGTGMRMARIGPAVNRASDPLPDELRTALRDRVLLLSLDVRLAIAVGILFLMTVKPSAITSVVVIVLAIAVGLVAGLLPARRSPNELRPAAG
ncbi:MAG: hypothetical protein E6I99_03140 [Chloroflexi bacterium]|nr:MAG: hypothetical protein E6I99_03140 [Chloroflexota bacterium]